MSEVDISPEAVERVAADVVRGLRTGAAALQLRALAARVREVEAERDAARMAWERAEDASQNFLHERDTALLAAMEAAAQRSRQSDCVFAYISVSDLAALCAALRASQACEAQAVAALEPALDVLEFHEGSAEPAVAGGEPVVQINGEDFANVLGNVRYALTILASTAAEAGRPFQPCKPGEECSDEGSQHCRCARVAKAEAGRHE